MTTVYKDLDDAILELLHDGPKPFHGLEALLSDQANVLAKPDRWGRHGGWRLIDRRLQSLRKRGLIESHRGYWLVVKETVAPAQDAA